jgi:hypothetical protein
MSKKFARVRVTIRGTSPLLQCAFGPDSIPLEAKERDGVAGNDPTEWRRTMMVTPEGWLYFRPDCVFAAIRDGARYTKKGRGSIQPDVCGTLKIEEPLILLNRRLPEKGDPPMGPFADVYVDVRGAVNPATKRRNVRYRLAASRGWECTFTIVFDKTWVNRESMRRSVVDAGERVGIGSGRLVGTKSIGMGHFDVTQWEELDSAEESTAAGSVAADTQDHLEPGQEEVQAVREAAEADGVPHRPHRQRKARNEQVQEPTLPV